MFPYIIHACIVPSLGRISDISPCSCQSHSGMILLYLAVLFYTQGVLSENIITFCKVYVCIFWILSSFRTLKHHAPRCSYSISSRQRLTSAIEIICRPVWQCKTSLSTSTRPMLVVFMFLVTGGIHYPSIYYL